MKLKELAIDGFGVHRNLQLGRFADGLSIIYGENGAGKSAVREFVRGTLFGFEAVGTHSNGQTISAGRLAVNQGGQEFQLSRDARLNPQLNVRSLDSFSDVERFDSLYQFAGPINRELYDTVFSFSFQETATNAVRLASVLQSQLGVQSGPAAAGDQLEYLNWQRESASRRDRLDAIQSKIDSIRQEQAGFLGQFESDRLSRQSMIAELEKKMSPIVARINELQTSSLQDQLGQVERNIAQLGLLIESAPSQGTSRIDGYSSLYLRLDEFDSQVRSWRQVQSDVQNQRVRLRDEMLIWNELTLDSDQHPYHTSRAILVALESKVEEAERNANLWSDAGGERVDTSQMAKTLRQLCQRMREDLYGLCNEMAQQYKLIRRKAAAAELKQLRRCYSEMGKNIDRLIKRRESAIRDIRNVDPDGADAIVRADLKFCRCAQHEGYLEARRRLVGPFPVLAAGLSTAPVDTPDLSNERMQFATLERQRSELKTSLSRYETEHQELENRLAEFARQRVGLLDDISSNDLKLQVRAMDSELENLTVEYNALRQRIELEREYVPTPPHPILTRACDLLVRITSGELSQIFLCEPIASTEAKSQLEIQVRDRFGKVLNISALEPFRQDQVYLCLALATKEQLKLRKVETPTIIDDAFSRIPSDQATATLTVLNEFASAGNQVIALTQHRYLADRIPGLAVFELPPTFPFISPASDPERKSGTGPGIVPLPEPDWGGDGYDLDECLSTTSLPRPYPLSKYPRTNFNYVGDDRTDPVTFSFPQSGSLNDHPSETRQRDHQASFESQIGKPAPSVSPVAVNSIGDRLGYASGVSETLTLGKVGFFDAQQLRNFEANGIRTVGDLLAIESNRSNPFGLNSDQLERWQSQLWLLINVPGMRINDARVLVACGITEPEQLETSHPQQLLERISRFLATSEGRRLIDDREVISLDRINGWYRSVDATRSNWQNRTHELRLNQARSSDFLQRRPDSFRDNNSGHDQTRTGRAASTSVQDESTAQEIATHQRKPRTNREPREARAPRMTTPSPNRKIVPRMAPASTLSTSRNKSAKTQPGAANKPIAASQNTLKFYLDLNDHIEAVPAIGPKTAERFEQIDVVTVADFLKQTAESMAIKIKFKRISADVIRKWQQQARFVCRVPNLRGHDAQLLVACGITEPEELATMQPSSLIDIIGPFSETKEGLKIVRNGKKPDLAEITDWISWAEDTRSLQAA